MLDFTAEAQRRGEMKTRCRIILSTLILISAVLIWFGASLQAGYADSPSDTRDSTGHPLGFLNPVTWELCGIMVKNATLPTTLEMLGWYGGLFLLVHLAALVALAINLADRARRTVAISFWLQLIVFPTGWVGLLYFLPHVAANFFAGKIGGETISDIPFWWTFQPLWFAISIAAGILTWRQRVSPERNETSAIISQSSVSPRLGGS